MNPALTQQDRVDAYAQGPGVKYPASIPWVAADDRIYAVWFLGNNYRSKSGYHGSYPPNFLDRITTLFPDAQDVLHLFSGSLPPGKYTRFDMRKDIDCDVRGNAEELSTYFAPGSVDVIYADPPYTEEDALKYGNPMVGRNKVMREVAKVLLPGGFIVWMDMVLPMYRKDEFKITGMIGLVRSTNHRYRHAAIFQRI